MKYVVLDLVNGKNVIGIWDDDYEDDKHSMRIIMPMQINRHSVMISPGVSNENVAGTPYLLFSDDLVVMLPMSRVVSASNLSAFSTKLYMSLLNKHHETVEFLQAEVFDFIKKDMTDYLQEAEERMMEELKEDQEEELHSSAEAQESSTERILH